METIRWMTGLLAHLDVQLLQLAATYGTLTYPALFAVIFAETGFVLTPFLPGDSLLFMAGALAAAGILRLDLLVAMLVAAAVAGDAVNYSIGSLVGPRIFGRRTRFLNQKHLEQTRRFYQLHGAMAIVMGRFMPIIRTFVPFVAGIASMGYRRFVVSNLAGAVAWVSLCTGAGFLWGNLPFVKRNFSLVILGVILVSLLPGLVQWARSRRLSAEQVL